MTKTPAEQAYYDLAQISMKLPATWPDATNFKRTWRVAADGNVIGYEKKKKVEEFGSHPFSERIAMAWAEGLAVYGAEKFALANPDLDVRHKQIK
jgi:hypothetical protein